MSFGENLSYCRKQLKITQEELAERMFVTRQTVSRWETNAAYPDVETLIKLCDILHCDMDTLVRGDATAERSEKTETPIEVSCCDLDEYDKHMNKFALSIALGVGIIVLGVALMMAIGALVNEVLSVIILLLFIGGAVADFIVSGISHTSFMKTNPKAPTYPSEQKQKFTKKFALMIAGATLLIFIAVVALILINVNIETLPNQIEREKIELLAVSIFLFLIAVSVFTYVYAGLLYSKYEVDKYNYECVKEGYVKDSGEYKQDKPKHIKIEESVSSIIMMGATIAFLLLGFISNLWHPAWVVFPIGGILSGIASIIINAFVKK